MKVRSSINTYIVFGIVPCLQRAITLLVRMMSRLSAALDIWAYSAARDLTEDRALRGYRKVNVEET